MSLKRSVVAMGIGLFAFCAGVAQADNYKVDPVHSSIVFRIKHFNVSWFYGRINAPEGTVVDDAGDPTKSSFDVQLKVANIDTGNPKRDEHLKSPDFFSAKEFPTLSFKSTSVKKAGDKLEVSGDLTIHGQTKPITVTLERVGAADTKMGSRVGYAGEFTIKRSDFGMSKMTDMLGDEVTIMLGLESVKG
jgi:polyisoprenoid-binding protein YceI